MRCAEISSVSVLVRNEFCPSETESILDSHFDTPEIVNVGWVNVLLFAHLSSPRSIVVGNDKTVAHPT